MSSQVPTFGVPVVSIAADDPDTTLPSLSTATIAASVLTPNRYNRQSINRPLNGSYKAILACFGVDQENGGYTFGIGSTITATLTPTLGQGILVRIAAGGFGALTGIGGSLAIAMFLKKGAADPQLTSYGIFDATQDFSFLLMEEALPSSPRFTAAALATPPGTEDPRAGSREPIGVLFNSLGTTTKGVRFRHKTTTVTVSPDDTVDYPVVTARATDVEFSVLNTELDILMQANGGNFVEFTDTNDNVVQQGASDLYTTAANIRGNQAIMVDMPPNAAGSYISRLHIGNVISNSAEYTEEYLKDAAPSTPLTLVGASLDKLLVPMFNGIFRQVN